MTSSVPMTVAIPTYGRDGVLLGTINRVLALSPPPAEVIILDQTKKHPPEVARTLEEWDRFAAIRWLRLDKPSIPGAINRGLVEASHPFVLFLDDDIIPHSSLVETHANALEKTEAALVAGRVIQPWQVAEDFSNKRGFHFNSLRPRWVSDFMGGNFSVRRDVVLKLGGFDERFVRVAYNFESEFAYRLCRAGHRIYYEPEAVIHHLHASRGGTRAFGDHLKSYQPNHAVGAYYFILRTWSGWRSLFRFLSRPVRSVATRHHLRRPWWIPATLIAEFSGMGWALFLATQGPRYLHTRSLKA
jgi:GT2 family glycosyltransferase